MITLRFSEDINLLSNDPEGMISNQPMPSFEAHKPDLEDIKSSLSRFMGYKRFILIGNGGSRTSAQAFYNGLKHFRRDAEFEFLTSCEPDWIRDIKSRFKPDDTLVIAISKSGENINSIEPLSIFSEYPVLAVTNENKGVLNEIAQKMSWPIIGHPEVGGRFSAMTTCGLVPAVLMGLDIDEIYSGAERAYRLYGQKVPAENNAAIKLASALDYLEKRGYGKVFLPIYSQSLFALFPLIVQLMHESVGKNGVGQVFFGDYAPESQHHTNQLLFGGPKDCIAVFIGVSEAIEDIKLSFRPEISDINFSGNKLGAFDGLSAQLSMNCDLAGVRDNCTAQGVPWAEIMVDKVDASTFAEFLVFWHYVAVYSAILRGQNPYDQPEVEAAKKLSLQLRIGK